MLKEEMNLLKKPVSCTWFSNYLEQFIWKIRSCGKAETYFRCVCDNFIERSYLELV